jgi:organic hydroperoxide reductase OsmC/OhrA
MKFASCTPFHTARLDGEAFNTEESLVMASSSRSSWAEKNPEGKLAIMRIILRPKIEFSMDRAPSAEELQSLHNSAHDKCYIANSPKSEVVVEAY